MSFQSPTNMASQAVRQITAVQGSVEGYWAYVKGVVPQGYTIHFDISQVITVSMSTWILESTLSPGHASSAPSGSLSHGLP